MQIVRIAVCLTGVGLLIAACGGIGGATRKEIEGNNTGGSIPVALAAGKDVQALADAHCARWSTKARITFTGTESGGDTVFVCETATGPAMLPTQPPETRTAPAAKQTPSKR